jgi:hypothetical protein
VRVGRRPDIPLGNVSFTLGMCAGGGTGVGGAAEGAARPEVQPGF